MKIPPAYFAYFALALLLGVILAFGVASVLHQPLPLQVPLSTQTLPDGTHTDKDIYAPAPAPIIVTTAPLPTITPVQTTVSPPGTNMCGINSAWNSTNACLVQEMASPYAAVAQLGSLLVSILPLPLILSFLVRIRQP